MQWGILIAGFWLIEVVAGNLADPHRTVVRLIYYSAATAAFTTPFAPHSSATVQLLPNGSPTLGLDRVV